MSAPHDAEWDDQPEHGEVTNRAFVAWGLILSISVCILAIFFASDLPDGLTHVAQNEGFATAASPHAAADGPFANYQASFIPGALGVLVAGAVGIAGVGLITWGLVRLLSSGRERRVDRS